MNRKGAKNAKILATLVAGKGSEFGQHIHAGQGAYFAQRQQLGQPPNLGGGVEEGEAELGGDVLDFYALADVTIETGENSALRF